MAIIYLVICSGLCACYNQVDIVEIPVSHQVDTKMLVTLKNEVLFSSNISGGYQLYQFPHKRIDLIGVEDKDVFNPFLIGDNLSGIYDNDGDEANHFVAAGNRISRYISPEAHLNFIQSTPSGSFVIFQQKDDSRVYLIDLMKDEKLVIADVREKFHAASFSKDEGAVVISVDDLLIRFDFVKREGLELAADLPGQKLNPFVYGDSVYFVNNSKFEFYSIYYVDMDPRNSGPKLVLSGDMDLRMPKFDGESLFFIEVTGSEYLLSSFDSERQITNTITHKGVVYNYEFVGRDSIVMTYSDFFRPRCIRAYSKSRKLLFDSECDSLNNNLSYEMLEDDFGPAYLFKPNSVPMRGVILFLHPGIHSDFSPRWDDILMALCANGFLIVAPNFPMSSGFGKSYADKRFGDACVSIAAWRQYILDRYDAPLYLLASSSGNVLMEATLSRDGSEINAAASLFGIRSDFHISPGFPILYVLGENDPTVDFRTRMAELQTIATRNRQVQVVSYKGEGHWFRNSENIRDIRTKIISLFLKCR